MLRPLLRELKDGCQDRVVAGGLERLLKNLAKDRPEILRLLLGYRRWPEEKRCQRLVQALKLLGVEAEAPEKKPRPAPIPKKGEGLPLETPLEKTPLGKLAATRLSKLGLKTLWDLVYHLPRRHEDRRLLPAFRLLKEGAKVTVKGVVREKRLVRTPKKGMQLVEVKLTDPFGYTLTAVWFNQPWVLKQIKEGETLVVTGRVARRGQKRTLMVEHFEPEEGESLSTGRIVPIYPSTEGISQAWLRRQVWRGLELASPLPEPLPEPLRSREGLLPLSVALPHYHFPPDEAAIEPALKRLKFDEYLFLELRVMIQSGESALVGHVFEVKEEWLDEFLKSLPFELTRAQKRVVREILADMQSDRQMARLLMGDVGSGKTVVAALALYIAAKNGLQGALMAPTEILAKQHYENLTRYLAPLGVKVELLVGSMKESEKKKAKARIAAGEVDVVVGTHALIQEGVQFKELGLAVIDEEHRFGVLQRRALLQGRPDVLVMTATPIPRSLALTLYGDLETSVLDELPPGRKPVKTKVLSQKHRRQAYAFALEEIKKGHQVYVVAPMIEESDSEQFAEVKAATKLKDEVAAMLPEVKIGLLHGRMSPAEKDAVMQAFRNKEFDLLVSTTVIEVGVDVPNATLMIVENAERFGLAQLHQLRGRVGRGSAPGYCILIAGEASKKTMERLRVLEESSDGFYVAEMDLKLRGPGELRGTRQSGMPELKLGELAKDTEIIEAARRAAKEILEKDPTLDLPEHAELKAELRRRSRVLGLREVI